MVNLATILITLLLAAPEMSVELFPGEIEAWNGRIRFFTEDLLLLSREADYWVVLEVTVLIPVIAFTNINRGGLRFRHRTGLICVGNFRVPQFFGAIRLFKMSKSLRHRSTYQSHYKTFRQARLPGDKAKVTEVFNTNNSRPALGDTLPNHKNKRRSNRRVWGEAPLGS